MDNLLSTKFLLAVLIVILSFALVVLNKSNVELFVTMCGIAIGFYTTGNVVQKFAPTPEVVEQKVTTVKTTEVK